MNYKIVVKPEIINDDFLPMMQKRLEIFGITVLLFDVFELECKGTDWKGEDLPSDTRVVVSKVPSLMSMDGRWLTLCLLVFTVSRDQYPDDIPGTVRVGCEMAGDWYVSEIEKTVGFDSFR